MGKLRSLELTTLVLPALSLLLFYGASGAHCSMVHGNMTDRRSLLDFKEALTDDPTGALQNWNHSIHHCIWSGISCSTRHPGRVTMLDLEFLNLTGQLTPSLGNLTFLRFLSLGSNRFSGQLPPLNRLRKLESLVLYDNLLQGDMRDVVTALTNCSKFWQLYLSENMLVGSIPLNIDSLSNLVEIDLSDNNLTGDIPPSFSNITNLRFIDLARNQLEGSIPEEFGQLRLQDTGWVALDGNRLSGTIPTTLFNISSLSALSLSMNMLSGHIPDSLGNASDLKELALSSNYFTGQIPSGLGKLHQLCNLNLDNNKLEARDSQSWQFLSALSNCPDLQILSLSGNELHGVLPHSVGNLSTMLTGLYLGANNLHGKVPSSIGALKNLENLHLGGNNFVGAIPYSISNLTELINLYLNDNQFDGW